MLTYYSGSLVRKEKENFRNWGYFASLVNLNRGIRDPSDLFQQPPPITLQGKFFWTALHWGYRNYWQVSLCISPVSMMIAVSQALWKCRVWNRWDELPFHADLLKMQQEYLHPSNLHHDRASQKKISPHLAILTGVYYPIPRPPHLLLCQKADCLTLLLGGGVVGVVFLLSLPAIYLNHFSHSISSGVMVNKSQWEEIKPHQSYTNKENTLTSAARGRDPA